MGALLLALAKSILCHQYGISALVPQRSFQGETSVGFAKFRLFYQGKTRRV